MSEYWIKNFNDLATNEFRKHALEIAEAGLDSIDTERVIEKYVRLDGESLVVKDMRYDLAKFKRIRVIGFGKASCRAAVALEKVLGSKIDDGIVVSLETTVCEYIDNYQGTHPKPSQQNVEISNKIYDLARDSKEDDLTIVVVSGGGSALLCWPAEECEQGERLYQQFLKTGGNILELNTVRKHISQLKGGGLAKLLYPATVVGLVFSDVPGDQYEMVSSGPTYKDMSTMEDAQKIIEHHGLENFKLIETPKEDKYFERVSNVVLVSNRVALEAMQSKAAELGYHVHIISSDMYDNAEITLQRFRQVVGEKSVILGGGEIKLSVGEFRHQRSGRALFLAARALKDLQDDEIFLPLASDGQDNGSDSAGAIADASARDAAIARNLSDEEDPYDFFKDIGTMIFTGPTGANVSDLMMLIRK